MPHVGRDVDQDKIIGLILAISIHVPHVGRDIKNDVIKGTKMQFQSTCPMWGATIT